MVMRDCGCKIWRLVFVDPSAVPAGAELVDDPPQAASLRRWYKRLVEVAASYGPTETRTQLARICLDPGGDQGPYWVEHEPAEKR